MNNSAPLTIILLTYNSSLIIQDSLQRLNNKKYRIIVVDNSSNDGTAEIVRQNFPQIKLIALPYNIGYGRANNFALRQVNSDFALVLNPDAILEEKYIDSVLEALRKHADIALAGPMVYSGKLKDGQIIDEILVRKNNDQSILAENADFYRSKFITGAAMFMNMKIMRQIGFFDEGFFLYGEDNEICKRAIRNGYQIAIIKNTKLIHLNGQSSKLSDGEIDKILWHKCGWSRCYYTQKSHNIFIAKLKALRMIIKSLLKIFVTIIKKQPINRATKGELRGSFAYFIGFKAFDKNDRARG